MIWENTVGVGVGLGVLRSQGGAGLDLWGQTPECLFLLSVCAKHPAPNILAACLSPSPLSQLPCLSRFASLVLIGHLLCVNSAPWKPDSASDGDGLVTVLHRW